MEDIKSMPFYDFDSERADTVYGLSLENVDEIMDDIQFCD